MPAVQPRSGANPNQPAAPHSQGNKGASRQRPGAHYAGLPPIASAALVYTQARSNSLERPQNSNTGWLGPSKLRKFKSRPRRWISPKEGIGGVHTGIFDLAHIVLGCQKRGQARFCQWNRPGLGQRVRATATRIFGQRSGATNPALPRASRRLGSVYVQLPLPMARHCHPQRRAANAATKVTVSMAANKAAPRWQPVWVAAQRLVGLNQSYVRVPCKRTPGGKGNFQPARPGRQGAGCGSSSPAAVSVVLAGGAQHHDYWIAPGTTTVVKQTPLLQEARWPTSPARSLRPPGLRNAHCAALSHACCPDPRSATEGCAKPWAGPGGYAASKPQQSHAQDQARRWHGASSAAPAHPTPALVCSNGCSASSLPPLRQCGLEHRMGP